MTNYAEEFYSKKLAEGEDEKRIIESLKNYVSKLKTEIVDFMLEKREIERRLAVIENAIKFDIKNIEDVEKFIKNKEVQ